MNQKTKIYGLTPTRALRLKLGKAAGQESEKNGQAESLRDQTNQPELTLGRDKRRILASLKSKMH